MKSKSGLWKRMAAVLAAVCCLISGSRAAALVKSADTQKNTELVKLDEKLGVRPGAIQAELSAHEQDGYYLGTPYDASPLTPENCMRPNGEYGGNGGMNCTGFVAFVLEKCGADLSGIGGRGYTGGKINASNWYHWITENAVEYYHYNTVEELLASGQAQKGDIIYFEPLSWEEEDADCHIGFFWGNKSNDNVFWHSATKPSRGNQISEIVPKSPSTVYLFKITHTGNVEIQKSSAVPEFSQDKRYYTLEGAEYALYQKSTGQEAARLVTDENGYARAEGLEPGEYEIREVKAPRGYLLNPDTGSITVKTGETAVYTCTEEPGRVTTELLLEKVDRETGETLPQGSASFAGARFTVRYYDCVLTNDPAAEGETPLRTWEFTTDADGKIFYSDEYRSGGDELYRYGEETVLPYGTLTIEETAAPEGYLPREDLFVLPLLPGEGTGLPVFSCLGVEEEVIRGDLELVKAADGTLKRLAGIPFQITSKTTGESHIIVTDENGFASTADTWNPHTSNTNAGTSARDGVWFGGGEPESGRGALPYDTYFIEELPCENNRDRVLIPPFEIVISRENHTVTLGTLTNDARPLPEIGTSARAADTETQTTEAAKNMVIIDAVSCRNLEPGKTYVIRGVLMDKETGEPLLVSEKEVRAEYTLTAEKEEETVELYFPFDASSMAGRQTVVFETMYLDEEKVAEHADLEDEGQTVTFQPEETPGTSGGKGPAGEQRAFTVKTGDKAALTLLILSLFLSCAVIVKCGRITLRK